MQPKSPIPSFLILGLLFLGGCSMFDHKPSKVSEQTTSSSTKETPPADQQAAQQQPGVADNPDASVQAPVDDGSGQIIPLEQLPTKKFKNGAVYPYAIKTKWPGRVKSPYAQDKQLVDVGTMTSGSLARCPHTGKIFVVP